MNPPFDVANYFAQGTLSETRDCKAKREDSSITFSTIKVAQEAVLGILMTEGVFDLFKNVVERHCSDLSARASLPITLREKLDPGTAQSIREQISKLIDDAKCFHSSQYKIRNNRGFEFDLPRRLEFRNELIEYFTVGEDDQRVKLRGQRGVRATKFIPVNTILGVYRGLMLPTVVVEKNLFLNPRNGWEGTVDEWRMNKREVTCDISAFEYENPLAFINDPRIDPYAEKKYLPDVLDGRTVLFQDDEECSEVITEANVVLQTVNIAAFPFPFILTIRSICSGEELLLDYGYDHFRNGGRTSAVNLIPNGIVDDYPM